MTRLNNILKKTFLKYGLPILTSGIILSGCNYNKGKCITGENDCECGHGVFQYNNGNVYKGYFKNGKPDGEGILFFSNGVKIEGTFKDGKPSPNELN